jgi:hypothetical protein
MLADRIHSTLGRRKNLFDFPDFPKVLDSEFQRIKRRNILEDGRIFQEFYSQQIFQKFKICQR